MKGKKPELSSDELKLKILKVARKHFAIQGFSGASLKDIAQEANVAGSLLNYHFKDKAGLFQAALETYARDRMQAVQRILGEVHSREELAVRIQLFVEEMLASIQADPHTFDIIDREMRSGNQAILKIFQETMLVAFQSVVDFIQKAKDRGLLREEVDPMIAAVLLFSSTCDSARKDVIGKKFFKVTFSDPEWSARFAKHVVGLFMNGVAK